MKRIILSALCAVPAFCMGQTLLYNDGAMVKVQAGATLYVEGGIHNTATGTIDNDGTIEVKGDFLNQGTWEPGDPNTLIFTGNVDSDVTPGTAVFQTVSIEKDNNFHVNLLGDMTVDNNLDFNAAGISKIYTGDFRLKIGTTGTATGYDADEYVVTDGTLGQMEKQVDADGTFFFPVGDATNYTPLESTYTGTGYASAKIRTRVNDVVHPDNPADATEYITRYWDVEASNITDYENELVGTYIPADIVLNGGNSGHIKGAVYDGADWTYAGADAGTNVVMGSTDVEDAEFTGANFFSDKLSLRVFLQGAYNTNTGVMSKVYSTNQNIEPQLYDSPYTDAPETVTDVPAGVTDWVKLELRDPESPNTVLGKASVFVRDSGYIVAPDGVSNPRIKNGKPTSIVAVIHRTHLAIRTPNAGIDVLDPTLYDFSLDTLYAYRNTSNNSNSSMKYISNTDRFVMWAANGNGNTNVRYGGPANDRDYLLGTILGGNTTAVISNTYSPGDYNMNGTVRYGGPANDRDFLLGQVLDGNTTKVRNRHF